MATSATSTTVDPEAGELTVRFDGRDVIYGFGELDTLVPAYAATIHKSQGSEYPAVVIPVLTQHYAMLQRNLLYTGVTRGKRLVVLVGQRKAIAIAVRNVSGRRRWSKLKEWLGRVGGRARRGSSRRTARNTSVKRWLGGLEPAWTLLDYGSFTALRDPPSPTTGPIRLATDLTQDEIEQSAVARNALILLLAASVGLQVEDDFDRQSFSRRRRRDVRSILVAGVRQSRRLPIPQGHQRARLSASLFCSSHCSDGHASP